MKDKKEKARIIVRQIAGGGAEAHHGGAWKVAYADFVTAMMAFFLLMWLLNATTEQQRDGLADYFNASLARTTGASGDGTEEGVKLAVEVKLTSTEQPSSFEDVARQVQHRLNGLGAESMQMRNLLKHVVTRMTDEGLVIELTDLTDEPLFVENSAEPRPVLRDLATVIAGAVATLRNQVAIAGHVRSYPEALVASPIWPLSGDRADTVRDLLEGAGFDDQRVQRVSGYADRKHRDINPMAPVNNRIEVILLR